MISGKRYCLVAAILAILIAAPVQADNVLLTLDLTNNDSLDPLSGGSWQLFARKVETGSGAQGDFGISGIRALVNSINISSISFASDINQSIFCGGGICAQTLSNGTIEIVYGQDISSPGVVTGVGVSANPNLDRLIASGIWPTGPRPTFGNDGSIPTAFFSEANFLGGGSPPFPASVQADLTLTSIVTLGDLNGSNTVTPADIALFEAQFLPPIGNPYDPAADINQSGTINVADYLLLIDLAGVPEPTSLMLIGIGTMALVTRRR